MDKKSTLQKATRTLLKPLIKLMLSNGVSFNEFSEWTRESFVEVAEKDFAIEGQKQTSTRISVITGIFRKDVARIRKNIEKPVEKDKLANRLVRIISAWRRESEYRNEKGEPKEIALSGDAPSLEHLVKNWGGDVSYHAVKLEMERLELIKIQDDKLKIEKPAYIPSKDLEKQLEVMGRATADLLTSIDHNIENPEQSRLQLSVAYEGISAKSTDKFKRMSEKQSYKLLKKFDQWLAENSGEEIDPDDNFRTGIGIYYFQEKK